MSSNAPLSSSPLVDVDSRRDVRSRLYKLAWPAMLDHLMHSAVFLINTAIVGRLGAEALSAAGISNQLMWFMITPVVGLSAGVLAMVARATGRGDLDQIQRVVRQGLVISIVFTGIVTAVVVLLAEQILQLLGAPGPVIAHASNFLRIATLFTVFQSVVVVVGSAVRATGDTRSPMVATGIMIILNGVIGYLLVFDVIGPGGLGLMGVALAFNVARLAAATYILSVLLRQPAGHGLLRGPWKDQCIVRRIGKVSGPAAAEQVITVGGIFASNVVALQLSTASFAAHNVIGPITSLPFMYSYGLSVAAAAAVGQTLGAQRPRLARRYGSEAVVGGAVGTAALGLVMVLVPEQFMAVFTSDPAVIAAGAGPLRALGFCAVVYGPGNVLPGVLRGAGDTRSTMVIALVALWAVRLPAVLVLTLGFGLGLMGVWLGLVADYLARSLLSYIRFASSKWQTIKV